MSYWVKKLNLKEDEEILEIIRKSLWAFTFPIVVIFLLIIGPFFFLFPLFSQIRFGPVIFFFSLALGVIYGIKVFILWYFNAWVVTTRRILDIDQRGFFDRVVSEISLGEIEDVSYEIKGLRQSLFHHGSVRLVKRGSKMHWELSPLTHPEKVHQLISELSGSLVSWAEHPEKSNKTPPRLSKLLQEEELVEEDILELLEIIKDKIGEEKFRQIVKKSCEE